MDTSATLRLWQHPSGIYKVFYLLVDGVTCTLIHSKDEVQKATCQVVMATLSLLLDVKGKRRETCDAFGCNFQKLTEQSLNVSA